jgi:hypothetical protein
MKRFIVLIVLLTAPMFLVASASKPAGASDLPLWNDHVDDVIANARWRGDSGESWISASQTTHTSLSSAERPPRQVYSSVQLCLELTTRRICGQAPLEGAQFQAGGHLSGATLSVVLPVHDCLRNSPDTCTDTSLQIDLTWTATAPLRKTAEWNNVISGGNCHINEQGVVVGRMANLTGTISDGGTDYLFGLGVPLFAELVGFRSETTGRGDIECF